MGKRRNTFPRLLPQPQVVAASCKQQGVFLPFPPRVHWLIHHLNDSALSFGALGEDTTEHILCEQEPEAFTTSNSHTAQALIANLHGGCARNCLKHFTSHRHLTLTKISFFHHAHSKDEKNERQKIFHHKPKGFKEFKCKKSGFQACDQHAFLPHIPLRKRCSSCFCSLLRNMHRWI